MNNRFKLIVALISYAIIFSIYIYINHNQHLFGYKDDNLNKENNILFEFPSIIEPNKVVKFIKYERGPRSIISFHVDNSQKDS